MWKAATWRDSAGRVVGNNPPPLLLPLLLPLLSPRFPLRLLQGTRRCLHLEELSSSLSLRMEGITRAMVKLPGPGCGPVGPETTWKENVGPGCWWEWFSVSCRVSPGRPGGRESMNGMPGRLHGGHGVQTGRKAVNGRDLHRYGCLRLLEKA